MQLACIVCISAFLVITFWCNVVYCEENAETKHTNNALQRTNVSFKHENYKFESILNSISAKNASQGELPKEESVSLGNRINDVASNIQNGGLQQQKLFSPISSDRITRVEDATLESLASTNVGSNNDVKGSTKLHNTTFGLTSLTNSINNAVKLAEENSIQHTRNNNSTEAREGQTTSLPKVLDPSFETLAAISRRAKRSNSNQQAGNHGRAKRSSFSIDNVDITGGKKYIKDIIGIENSDYQYRSPWRIPSYKSYSHKNGAVSKDIKRQDPSHMKSQSSDVKADIVQPSLENLQNYIPVVSSLQDEYHKQKSSDYLKSLPYVSVDGTSKRNSISSLPSSLPYSLSPQLKEDISSSPYNNFDFKKSIYLKPYQKYSDQQHRQQPYRGHQVHNHNNINYQNSNILNENKPNLKESVLSHNRPIFPETLKLSSANKEISRKSTESSTNEERLQNQQKGKSSSLLVLPPAVEEPLMLASRKDPSRGGQREQLPAATSDIISAGKSMVRGIMKRRLKTGRYDVPQVGKYHNISYKSK